jgi:hypothetical protein
MNRREFAKLLAVAVAVPSLGLTGEEKLPVKFRYKGFDVVVSERLSPNPVPYLKQAIWRKGKYCSAILLESDDISCLVETTKTAIDLQLRRKKPRQC